MATASVNRASFDDEVKRGDRFRFGRNWSRFLSVVDDRRIAEAGVSLRTMLGVESLQGKSFLDVGSGSGLFSLAARQLGATVHSFDFDPQSVACTTEMRRRYRAHDPQWRIDRGSILDREYLAGLGRFDIVYSWGVLHHTGAMWSAMENVVRLVEPGGRLFIAVYNDQGEESARWWRVKKRYCSGWLGRSVVLCTVLPYQVGRPFLSDLFHLRDPFARHRNDKRGRGMSFLHDWIDWLGGFPYEVASVDAVREFCGRRGLTLDRVTAVNGYGNNEFVFTLCAASPDS